jgi:hypothetical protein
MLSQALSLIDCRGMRMWTSRALVEALGPADVTEYHASEGNPQRRLPIMRWHCQSGGQVTAFCNVDGSFNLEVDCNDRRHHDLQHMPDVRVRNVQAHYHGSGETPSGVPGDLLDTFLDFELDTPVPVRLRVEAHLDSTAKLRAVEEFDVGNFEPGHHTVAVPLFIDPQGPGAQDGPARSTVELRIEMLDVKTGSRDWGAEGILLYSREFSAL